MVELYLVFLVFLYCYCRTNIIRLVVGSHHVEHVVLMLITAALITTVTALSDGWQIDIFNDSFFGEVLAFLGIADNVLQLFLFHLLHIVISVEVLHDEVTSVDHLVFPWVMQLFFLNVNVGKLSLQLQVLLVLTNQFQPLDFKLFVNELSFGCLFKSAKQLNRRPNCKKPSATVWENEIAKN